jgi:hypothetical protein
MNIITIPIQQGQTLADALKNKGYQTIPSDVVFDKTLTGIGATYMEIHAERNSIIIEPNVPVIEGKCKQHSNCFAIKKGVKDVSIKKYLNDDTIQYKKILTTPESFSKITKAAIELGINIHDSYFCLFDECEKISQDYDYRENIAFPIADFYKFKNKAFISATPTGFANKKFEELGFEIMKVQPVDFDHKIKLQLITTNVIKRAIHAKLQELITPAESSVFVFYNSISGIKEIINTFHLKPENYSVFCSDSRYNELITEDYNVQKQVNDTTIKKINFLTSRYFSAVDFNLSVCPDIVMITNQSRASHSRIDPLSEAIQIQGRFRKEQPNGKKINSICHITDLVVCDALNPQQIDETLQQWYQSAKLLKQRYYNADSSVKQKAILEEYKKSSIYPYLDTPDFNSDFRINLFSLMNFHYKERVKACYSSSESLVEMYKSANYFDVVHTDMFDYNYTFGDKDIPTVHIRKRTSQKEHIQTVVKLIQLGNKPETILSLFKDKATADQYVNTKSIIDAIAILGTERVEKLKTYSSIESQLIVEKESQIEENKRFSEEVINAITVEFGAQPNFSIPKKEIQNRLQLIYDKFQIKKKTDKLFKVTQSTIEDYYLHNNNKEKQTYTLKSLKPEFLAKINKSESV